MGKKEEELSIMEAMGELSKITEIDHTMSESELAGKEIRGEKVVQTFKVLHGYLKSLYEKDKDLEDPHTRRGVQAIMGMASEAAEKIDRFTVLFKDVHGGVHELKEFQDLQQLYLKKIRKRLEDTMAHEEAWETEWGGQDVDLWDIERRGLKDLETIRRDKDYELFYIRKEDGRPFFHRNLVRHIRLVGEFDDSITDPSGEDPFLRIKALEDAELHTTAKDFLAAIGQPLDSFFHHAMKYKESDFIMYLAKAAMALYLAANPRNQLQNTMGKSSLRYFLDFHKFLRQAFQTEEYKSGIEMGVDRLEPAVKTAFNLSAQMAAEFFTRKYNFLGVDKLLLDVFQKATGHKPFSKEGKNPLWLWNSLLEDDEKLRSLFNRYPNGPMMKTLDILREGDEREGYDPLSQDNWPAVLFCVALGDRKIDVLRLPAPVVQTHIDVAPIADEFREFLRRISAKERDETLLVFNLQNRTSWQEHARVSSLENIQKSAEFNGHVFVVTLPMDTDFYLQADIYEKMDEAKLFKEQLFEQFSSGEECGYFFPAQLLMKDHAKFAKVLIEAIHELFFAGKTMLLRKNRLDFIEAFHLFLIVYFMMTIQPNYLSFTCKDAIDTGAVMSAALFSLIKIFKGESDWSENEKAILLKLLYAPAFMLRERAVDKPRLHRSVSALSLIQAEVEAQGEKLAKSLSKLFPQTLTHLNFEEVT